MHNLNAPAVSRTVRARSQRLARRLFDTYQPNVLVLENFNYPGSRRRLKTRWLRPVSN